MRFTQSSIRVIILLCLLVGFLSPILPGHAEDASSFPHQQRVDRLLSSMTPEEKVGQLFLVTFTGTEISEDTPIYNLIVNYHIGGVILSRDNGNILSGDNAQSNTRQMIEDLQRAEYQGSLVHNALSGGETQTLPAYIPLLVGVSQEGDYSSHTELLEEMTALPSQMAIGATWEPAYAEEVGRVLGKELSAMGINLLLGPSLDVLENPHGGDTSDLGVRSFGGDPFWVGRMGQSYIKGVHEGSENRVLAVGKYFPGLGSADRLPEEEIATVRKSLEQLKQIELAPFFAVTGFAEDPSSTVDGLLTSHIRYQGLQGNIRSTTRPISLDPQAFDLLMKLEPFNTWRTEGGLMISDNLGSQALRKLFDPTGATFNARQVALDAFIAGNDILYLGNLGDQEQETSFNTIQSTLEFFSQKYRDDQTFAERVDSSVERILAKKFQIYEIFYISHITPDEVTFEPSTQIVETIARSAATLISPSLSDIDNTLPQPPQVTDRLVIMSDTYSDTLCEDCAAPIGISPTSLENSILKLYGPEAGRQVIPGNITSFSYSDIITMLDNPENAPGTELIISRANWIIVAMLNVDQNRPESRALHRLLSERQDLIREKRVVVFAFNAPYYLDATNISKINAYYGLYSKLPSFQDVAARILFKEIPNPPGDLPVSVPGVGYDLISATSPDPDQSFELYLQGAGVEEDEEKPISNEDAPSTPAADQPTETPAFPIYNIGDVVALETGVILDHNGHPVPDGTPVQFVVVSEGETNYLPLVETLSGKAATSFLVEQGRNLQVYAISSPAQSKVIEIKIAVPENGFNEETPLPATPTASPTSPVAESSNPFDSSSLSQQIQPDLINWASWGLSFLFTAFLSLIAYQLGSALGQVRWGIRWAFTAFLGGMLIYNYLALGLPGSGLILTPQATIWRVAICAICGAVLGWGVSFMAQNMVLRSLFQRSSPLQRG